MKLKDMGATIEFSHNDLVTLFQALCAAVRDDRTSLVFFDFTKEFVEKTQMFERQWKDFVVQSLGSRVIKLPDTVTTADNWQIGEKHG
jgi:hypothetical protein